MNIVLWKPRVTKTFLYSYHISYPDLRSQPNCRYCCKKFTVFVLAHYATGRPTRAPQNIARWPQVIWQVRVLILDVSEPQPRYRSACRSNPSLPYRIHHGSSWRDWRRGRSGFASRNTTFKNIQDAHGVHQNTPGWSQYRSKNNIKNCKFFATISTDSCVSAAT